MNWKILYNDGLPLKKSSAFAAMAGGLFDSVVNYISNSETNETNESIAYNQMKWQERENEKNRAWEEKQKEVERLYNSPANQMELYRQAHLNPYLVGQAGQITNGNVTAPSSPAPQGAPNTPTIRPYQSSVGSAIGTALDLALRKKSVDASSADSTAKAEREIIDNAVEIRKYFGNHAAEKYYTSRMQELRGASLDSSEGWHNILNQYKKADFESKLQAINAQIANKYGLQRAEAEIAKMNDEMMEIHGRIGLWSSIARLNDSNVQLNAAYARRVDSEIQRNIAEAYRSWSEGSYVRSLKLTEDEKRQWFLYNLMLEAQDKFLSYGEHEANYAENEGKREYQHTDVAKSRVAWSYGLGQSYAYQTSDKLLSLGQKALGIVVPFKTQNLTAPVAPWQVGYARHNASRPTHFGKENVEWFTPYNP